MSNEAYLQINANISNNIKGLTLVIINDCGMRIYCY